MSSRLLVNLIDPSEIVVPDTDGVPDAGAPDTGILSISKWLDEAFKNDAALFIAIGLTVLVAVVIAVLLIRRRKKQSLIKGFGGYAPMKLGAQKYLVPKLAGLSFVVLVSVFGILKFYDGQRMVNAETADGSSLTVTTEDITAIDIEMTDEAVFGVGESKVKVTTATETGYTLMAYVDSTTTDLTNGSGDTIGMLETSQSQALTDNTWGISLSKPNSQEETLFRGLPTAEKDAMVVKVSGSSATEANDETTLYYAAYVTPELDYGTYEGVTINYVAVAHVLDEDVTVNFHGNGYYFDEAGTKDVNTVTYGTSCGLAYVGGNCTKVYTTEEPYVIVKTPNIRDDGTQDGPYEIPEQVKVGMASAPGADYLKVELTYNLNGEVVVAQGNENLIEEPEVYEMFGGQGEITYTVEGDTVSLGMFAVEAGEGYDYGFYAKIYPIYSQKPENIETVESMSCYFAKSDNLDDEGNMVEPYYDGWQIQTAALPGADRVKIDIEYALTSDAYIAIFEGQVEPGPNMPSFSYMLSTWDGESGTTTNISGRETFIVDGSTVTFMMSAYNMPVSDYDYGFYARLYPVYDEEHEGTVPGQVCSFTNKSGVYSLPVGYGDGSQMRDVWYDVIDDGGYLVANNWFDSEVDFKEFIVHHLDLQAEKTIDLYLNNYYYIGYDGNGGSGSVEEQWVLPHTNVQVYHNGFVYPGYRFVGWNTRADGRGTWYQPDDVVLDLARPDEVIILYAQWEFSGYNGVINYYPNANGVSDSMGEQYYTESDTSVVLWASNYRRSGYGFAGWSDTSNWILGENDINGNGTGSNAGYHIYGPNQTIGLAALSGGQLNLYAVWVPSAGNLQGWSCPNNSNMPVGSITALTDLRDNDTYAVAKLADGKCWMIENLRLDYDADFNPSLSQGFGGLFSGLANPETSFNSEFNSLYKGDDSGDVAGVNGATMTDIGSDWMFCGMPRYNNNNTNVDSAINPNINVSNVTGANQNIYSYGNYYTWPAARAGTDRYISKTSNTSICPAGWRLPNGGWGSSYYSTSDYWQLVVMSLNEGVTPANYSTGYTPYYSGLNEASPVDTKIRNFPNNFVQSGYFGSDMIHNRGVLGEYWSHNESVINAAFVFSFESTLVRPGSYDDFKDYGIPIRCVLSPNS